MIDPRNVFAWTPHGSAMPAYVSLNSVSGGYELTVRSGPEAGSMCAWISLGPEQLRELLTSLNLELGLCAEDEDPLAWPFGPKNGPEWPEARQ